MSIEALKAGKHVMCTVPMATTIEECQQICRARRRHRPQVHDGRNRRLQPRVPVHQGHVPEGRARQDPAPRRLAPAGHGRLARLLGKDDPHALRHPRRQPLPGPGERRRRIRQLLRLRHRPRRHPEKVRQQVRRRDPATSRSRTPTSPAHIWRFLYDVARQYRESFDVYGTEEKLRVDARRARAAHHPHRQKARAGNPHARSKSPTSPTCCPSRSAASRSRPRSTTPEHLSFIQGGGHGGSHPHLVNEFISALTGTATPGPTPPSPPTGPASASAPTSRP